jgi:hypothetical protein
MSYKDNCLKQSSFALAMNFPRHVNRVKQERYVTNSTCFGFEVPKSVVMKHKILWAVTLLTSKTHICFG